MIECKGGAEPIFQPKNDEERAAYEYLSSIFDDERRIYEKLHLMYRTDRDKQLRDRLGTHVIEGFTATQQRQIIDLMRFLSIELINHDGIKRDGKPKLGLLKEIVEYYLDTQTRRNFKNDEHRNNLLDKVLENYDAFWKMTHQNLTDLGLETDDEGSIIQSAGLDADIDHWNDQARLQRDPKGTSSTKVKFTLSFIPKVEWKRDEKGNIIKDDDGRWERKKVTDLFGGLSYASMDEIYDTIGEMIADYMPPEDIPNKYEAYINHLEKVSKGNAQMMETVQYLRSIDDKTFQSDFVNSLGKHYTTQSMVIFRPNIVRTSVGRSINKGYTLMVLDSNRTNQKNTIKNSWYESQKVLPIVSQDKDGDLRINQSEVESIKNEYISRMNAHLEDGTVSDDDAMKIIQETLEKLGINIPLSALEEIADNPRKIASSNDWSYHVKPNNGGTNNTDDNRGMMGYIFDAFLNTSEGSPSEKNLTEYGKLGLNNPVYGRDSQGVVDNLARVTAKYTRKVYSPSWRNVKGNTIYGLQDHTSLSREFNRLLQNPEEYIKSEGAYSRQSRILKAVRDNVANIRNIIGIDYIDGLKEYTRSKGSEHSDMSDAEKHLMRLALFQRAQRNKKMQFLSPTLSDKGRDYIITLPMLQDLFPGMEGKNPTWIDEGVSSIDQNGTLDLSYTDSTVQIMYDMARGEIERILNIQQELENENGLRYNTHPLGSDYMEQGQFFYHYPELNPENLTEKETKKLWITKVVEGTQYFKLKNPQKNNSARMFIQKKLRDTLVQSVKETKELWKDLGLTSGKVDNWLLDRGYLKDIPYQMSDGQRKLTYAALDYQLSNRFFLSNIAQILSGDPAEHIKNRTDPNSTDKEAIRKGRIETTNKTIDNIQKRYANQIAPAITGNWGSENNDHTVNMITMSDRFYTSNEIDEYRKELPGNLADAYEDIESTDAQEYTTMREHMRMELAHGKVDRELYDKVINIIDEAGEGGYYNLKSELTESEYNTIFIMPHKPVYVGKKYYSNIDTSVWMYRKTSAIPLIPEMVKDTGLDRLRIAMEKKNVDRAAYQTADKLGAYNKIDPFDNNGDFLPVEDIVNQLITENDVANTETSHTMNDLSVQTRSRNDLGLQFEIPYKDKRIKTISQLNKMKTLGLKKVKEIEIEGEKMSGKDAEIRLQEYRTELFKIAQDKLLKDLNIDIPDDANIEDISGHLGYKSYKKLQQILLDEAEDREWSPAAIDTLELDENGEFVIPLSFTPNTSQIESLLISVINSRIINQEMYGSSYVQVSGSGWTGITPKSGGTYITRNYDPEIGLRHVHKKDGEVQPAHVLVTWDFKDENGNLLNPEDFTDEEGYIDDNKLNPEMRKIIGGRIPYQGHSSGIPLEIVGFLPPTLKKTMVVTEETVAQMGSDFDVDKLYTYENRYTLNNDTLDVSSNMSESDTLKKNYMDALWSIMTHPEVMKDIIKPLDMPYLSEESDFVKEKRSKDEPKPHDALNPNKQVSDHTTQQAGKELIGIFSDLAIFNAMLEMYDLPMTYNNRGSIIQRNIRYEKENGEIESLTQVGGDDATVEMNDNDKGTISDIIKMYQNGAVDNAKELILDALNTTINTANVIGTTIMLNNGSNGLPLQHLTRFFSQDVIKEIDKRVKAINSQLNDEFTQGDTQEQVINDLIEELEIEHGLKASNIAPINVSKTSYDAPVIPKVSVLTNNLDKTYNDALNNKNDARMAITILRAYKELYTVSKGLDGIKTVVNFGDRKGPGKSVLHSIKKVEQLNDLDSNAVFRDGRDVLENTEWGQAAQSSFVLSKRIFSDLFKYNSDIFRNLIHELDQNTNRGITPDKALEVFRELRSYVFSNNNLFENIEGERERLAYGENNIAQRVMDAMEDWGNENFFMQRLRPKLPEKSEQPARVEYSADKGERLDEIRIIQSFSELLLHEDIEKRTLAEDLVTYSYIVSGGVQTPTSFTQYIPIGYLLEKGLKKHIDNFDFDIRNSKTYEIFRDQFFQHNPKEAYTLTNKEIEGFRNIPEFKFDSKKHSFLVIGSESEPKLRDYFSFYDTKANKWRLYKLKGFTYHEIDTLGKANEDGYGTVEYNQHQDKLIGGTRIESNRSRLKHNPFVEGDPKIVDETPSEQPLENLVDNKSQISSETFFNSVRDNIDNTYINELIEFMSRIDDDFNIVIYPPEAMLKRSGKPGQKVGDVEGNYNPNKNSKNIYISKHLKDPEYIARTIAHEWIHKNTVHLNKDNINAEQERLFKKLHGIAKRVVKSVDSEKFVDVVTDNNGDIDIYEFMAYSTATNWTQNHLADININGKSALEQIRSILKKMLTSLAKTFGIDIDPNSALSHTIDSTLRIIEENQVRDPNSINDNPKSKSEKEVKSENNNEIDFMGELKKLRESKGEETKETKEKTETKTESKTEDKSEQLSFMEQLDKRRNKNQTSLGKTVGEFRVKGDEIDTIFENNSDLSDIGTKDQYIRYLSTVFPNSKVNQIVYHGSPVEINEFDLSKKTNDDERGIFFFSQRESAQRWIDGQFQEKNTNKGDIVPTLINLTNPYIEKDFSDKSAWKMSDIVNDNIEGDGAIIRNVVEMFVGQDDQFSVFNTKDMHILGSDKDIRNFEDFIKRDYNTPSYNTESLGQSVGEFRRNLSDRQKEIFDQNRNRFQTKCN